MPLVPFCMFVKRFFDFASNIKINLNLIARFMMNYHIFITYIYVLNTKFLFLWIKYTNIKKNIIHNYQFDEYYEFCVCNFKFNLNWDAVIPLSITRSWFTTEEMICGISYFALGVIWTDKNNNFRSCICCQQHMICT